MCTLNNHILLSKLTPFECRVRPSLDIECFPQHQAKSSFFFPLQSLSALSERFFFIYLFFHLFSSIDLGVTLNGIGLGLLPGVLKGIAVLSTNTATHRQEHKILTIDFGFQKSWMGSRVASLCGHFGVQQKGWMLEKRFPLPATFHILLVLMDFHVLAFSVLMFISEEKGKTTQKLF